MRPVEIHFKHHIWCCANVTKWSMCWIFQFLVVLRSLYRSVCWALLKLMMSFLFDTKSRLCWWSTIGGLYCVCVCSTEKAGSNAVRLVANRSKIQFCASIHRVCENRTKLKDEDRRHQIGRNRFVDSEANRRPFLFKQELRI